MNNIIEYISENAKNKNPDPIKKLYEHMNNTDMISLGGGLPNPKTFIFSSINFNCYKNNSSKYNSRIDNTSISPIYKCLQYGTGKGLSEYYKIVYNLTRVFHSPIYNEWDVIPSAGNTDALDKIIRLLFNKDDYIISDKYTYPGFISNATSSSINIVGIEMDNEGILPNTLDNMLKNVDLKYKIKALYLIPTGQNPTGITMSYNRKKEIYKLAQKYDLIIIEDDPYYHIQFNNIIPSFLSLDTDGRVIRLDSFSKILAPGLRCGWITASKCLINYLIEYNESSIQSPCGISQGIIAQLIENDLKLDGWKDHLCFISNIYKDKRNFIIKIIQKYLNINVKYEIPQSGMFLWIEITSKKKNMQEIFDEIIKNKVLIIPGHFFNVTNNNNDYKHFIRISFSYENNDNLEKAIKQLNNALKDI